MSYHAGVKAQTDGERFSLEHAVEDVLEAAVQWANADYGDVNQLTDAAALADAVREYRRARAAGDSLMRASGSRPDRLDV